ncbi:hypothetical protein NDU88_006295 [Pleurodeles waltl]|uniref:PiggyBac transposable element-derived protein domain-containing protein n=1 Tax=Pleurodeles waltl TaxID=8319 RepID=A0AAV7N1X9_PLEWA|nr:hypothetical protein NDU88_006295 [Pleurodeles waltl]
MPDINEDVFKQDLNMFIQSSVKHALQASMEKMSKNIENTVKSMVSNSLAHSAGEGRKRKQATAKSAKGAQLDSEVVSQQTEDLIPPRLPVKEGNITKELSSSHSKCKFKSKHIDTPKKMIVSKNVDIDDEDMDDLSHSDNPDDIFPPSLPPSKRPKLSLSDSSPNIVDSEGVPMFDPSLIHHPNSTESLPSDHVGDYISSRLHLPRDKQTRAKLRSGGRRPSLESNITATPTIDQSLITFFTTFGKDPRKGVERIMASHRVTTQQVVGMLFELSSDHDYETNSAAEAEEEERESGNNFYTGVQLFKELFRVDTVVCDTIRSNQKGYPRELVCKKPERGQCSALRNDELLALKFVDRRDVYMLTTIHDESTSTVAVWGQVADVRKPESVIESLVMVDHARVLRVAVVEDVARLKDRHFPDQIPPTPKKDFPAKKCRVCARRGIRRESRMYCPYCL